MREVTPAHPNPVDEQIERPRLGDGREAATLLCESCDRVVTITHPWDGATHGYCPGDRARRANGCRVTLPHPCSATLHASEPPGVNAPGSDAHAPLAIAT